MLGQFDHWRQSGERRGNGRPTAGIKFVLFPPDHPKKAALPTPLLLLLVDTRTAYQIKFQSVGFKNRVLANYGRTGNQPNTSLRLFWILL